MSESSESVQQRKRKKGGKYCVSGTANGVSCKNGSHTPNVSIHKFQADPVTRNAWVKFVCKHRPHFMPLASTVLCSAHFEQSCFTRLSGMLPEDSTTKQVRNLQRGSVPTRDTISFPTDEGVSPRLRRQVRKAISFTNIILSASLIANFRLLVCCPSQVVRQL